MSKPIPTPEGTHTAAAIRPLAKRDMQTLTRLLAVWESAVRATHTFLSEEGIGALKPEVLSALAAIPQLYLYCGANNAPLGFLGVAGQKIEMLFVAAAARGQGIGKQLLCYATQTLGAVLVDVNEQNRQALGFYRHMGFAAFGRSAQDAQGRLFPLLHLCLPPARSIPSP